MLSGVIEMGEENKSGKEERVVRKERQYDEEKIGLREVRKWFRCR